MKWLRYSGMVISVSVNPLYWKMLPWWKTDSDQLDWAFKSETERTVSFGFLFLTVRIWIDNGQW